jgi:hypothetical protein
VPVDPGDPRVIEVSLLLREKPAEPGARVALIYEPKPKPTRRPAAGPAQRQPTPQSESQRHYCEELARKGILVRDFGQIIAVR